MEVLIVKLTSMGDLIQALPALTDARRARPGIEFDWVVDEAFAEIPAWHPAVRSTIATAHRRWRKSFGESVYAGEFGDFWRRLRARRYDAVIDAQSNIKSALVTLATRGPRHGPDRRSVREYPAHMAYRHRYTIAKNQLAIERWRQLFARVLDYPCPDLPPDFGLDGFNWPAPACDLPSERFLVLVHNASWPNKCWPEPNWHRLIDIANDSGYSVVLPWGSEEEEARAMRLAENHKRAQVLPRLSLSDLGAVFTASAGAVCVDTGLAHMSAALGRPTLTLYGPTSEKLIGATGPAAACLPAEGFRCSPCYRRACSYGDYQGPEAQCLKAVEPDRVWQQMQRLLSGQTA